MKNPIIPFYKQIDIYIEKSKGCYLYDSNGKQYIDFESGDWAANLGHSNEKINSVIKKQADLLMHDGLRFRNKQSEDLSFRILEKLSIHDGKCVFLNSGSEAVNLGITIAKNLTKRNKVLKMDCSYLSAFGHGQIYSPNEDLINISVNSAESIKEIDFKEIAAFVFEPGNSRGLVKFPTNEFVKLVANMVKQNGGVLMANEVTTGFGRTGKWFGFQHYDFIPDIVSIGKGLGNGYPVSCLAVTKEVSNLFSAAPFRYAQSHQNDPLGCAVGLEVIKVMEDENLINRSFETGEYFKDKLKELQKKYPDKIKDIRARGLMIALEFFSTTSAENIYMKLIEKGFLTGCRENTLGFMPPLIIEWSHIDDLAETIDELIKN